MYRLSIITLVLLAACGKTPTAPVTPPTTQSATQAVSVNDLVGKTFMNYGNAITKYTFTPTQMTGVGYYFDNGGVYHAGTCTVDYTLSNGSVVFTNDTCSANPMNWGPLSGGTVQAVQGPFIKFGNMTLTTDLSNYQPPSHM